MHQYNSPELKYNVTDFKDILFFFLSAMEYNVVCKVAEQ